MKKTIFKTHLILLVLILLNALFKKVLGIGLIYQIEFILKFVIVLTGLMLFVLYFKPFKKRTIYFSIYPISILLLGIALIVRGIFAALIISALLIPIYPDNTVFQKDDIIIYSDFSGLFRSCCNYKISKRQFYIFKVDYGYRFSAVDGGIDFENFEIQKVNNTMELRYAANFYDIEKGEYIKKDTILILKPLANF